MSLFSTVNQPVSSDSDDDKPHRAKRTAQIGRMQDVLLVGIEAPQVKLTEAAQASRAWVDLEAMRREILRHGKPKPVPAANDASTQGKPKRGATPIGPATLPPDSAPAQ